MRSRVPNQLKQAQLEVEVKLKVRNLQRLHRDLLAMGCEKQVGRSLEQNWTWDFPGQSLRQQGKLLRVRQFAGHCLLTFKGTAKRSRHFKVREEREMAVQDPETLCAILERLGLEVIFRYEKYRTAYSFKSQRQQYSVNLAVDETPIGNYLEIEGRQADIIRVAAQLGLGGKDAFIKESYLALFAKSRLRRSQEHMVFPGAVNARAPRV
jgi:adenylate cyclase class 2